MKNQEVEYHELKAETRTETIEIGYFKSIEEATIAAISDRDGDDPVICLYDEIEYVWNEETVA